MGYGVRGVWGCEEWGVGCVGNCGVWGCGVVGSGVVGVWFVVCGVWGWDGGEAEGDRHVLRCGWTSCLARGGVGWVVKCRRLP